jgi:hypothetical protein
VLGAAFYDTAAGAIVVDVTAVAQGNTGATRIGDSLTLQSLNFAFNVYNQGGVNSNSVTTSRILFFQYLGDSSVAGKPTIAEMFNASLANAGTTYGAYSAFDIDYARTYRILHDVRFLTYGAPAAWSSTDIGLSHLGHFLVPLSRAQRQINFQAGATTGNNHIFLCVTSDKATTAANPQVSYNLDVRFTDL